MDADPRSYQAPELPVTLKTAAIVPLRSAGVVIGTVSVYNRRDGQPFSDNDLQLLQILGDQVVVGLDRASVLEESRRNERRAASQERRAAAGHPAQERVPGQHVARAAHAAQRHHRLLRSDPRRRRRARSPSSSASSSSRCSGTASICSSLINSVLDLSKIEAGRMTLSLAVTDLREAITGAVTDTASLRTAKQPGVHARAGRRRRSPSWPMASGSARSSSTSSPTRPSSPPKAGRSAWPPSAPAPRCGSPPTGPATSAALVTQDVVWVSVTDEGIGIEREDMPKLFQEFSQVDSSASRQAQGTGLGLALCKKFVEMHGGTIGADSISGPRIELLVHAADRGPGPPALAEAGEPAEALNGASPGPPFVRCVPGACSGCCCWPCPSCSGLAAGTDAPSRRRRRRPSPPSARPANRSRPRSTTKPPAPSARRRSSRPARRTRRTCSITASAARAGGPRRRRDDRLPHSPPVARPAPEPLRHSEIV